MEVILDRMNPSSVKKIALLLAALAAVMVVCPAMPSVGAASSNKQLSMVSASKENLILLRRQVLDTEARMDRDTSKSDMLEQGAVITASTATRTRIVQFRGPVKRKWLDSLLATGAEIVGYLPNNAYIIRADRHAITRVAMLDGGLSSDDARPIRWMGKLDPVEKLDPTYTDELLSAGRGASFDVEVELIQSRDSSSIDAIGRAALAVNREPRRFGSFLVLSVKLGQERLIEIAGLEDVLFIGPASELRLHDELSAQIIAGNVTPDRTQPSGPGYREWLASKGLDEQSDFVVDVTDSGLDRGSALPTRLHPDFLDAALQSRVAYIFNYAPDGLTEDRRGHGTIVASVALGSGANGRKDAPGYLYGLGVDPAVRLGVSRIFDETSGPSRQVDFTTVASSAYSAGARVSNNSWGTISPAYDTTSQEYDWLVRDAQPSVPGNQEMVFVFSVANAGAGGRVGSPGTAKNVISVAASENYRPAGLDSCNLDGEGGIGPEGADNALDILRYSSGGPTADGRAKPDIAAPGTHIFGAASQAPAFFGEGLCPGAGLYQPPGQSLYTWSSGTSLSAPHVTGAASLLRKFFTSRNFLSGQRAPSPAMTKAYLMNSASYMTGENAAGNLPGSRQGWGLVDLSRAFDGAARTLIDQTTLFTETGQTVEIQGSLADPSLPFRATLVWTDAPGALLGPAIVNDLDLEVTVGGVSVYRGNNFLGAYSVLGGEIDRLNNVESIYLPPDAIPSGGSGNLTITVRAANIVGDGVPGNGISFDQDFALVIYNLGAVVVPPLPKKVPIIADATYVKKLLTVAGRDFSANAQVEINGKLIDRSFEFDSTASSLTIKLKRRKLNLHEGDNQIVLIEDGERSLPFVLRL